MRSIGDTNHPSICEAKELQVYFWKENKFKLISSQNFPKCEPGKCVICPISYSKYDNKQVLCRNRIEKFGAFKAHLANAERTFGELVAFPADCKSLPSVSIYHKFRRYGQLHSYIQGSKERFHIFDIKQNKFIKVEKANIGKLYTNGKHCTYCPCERKMHSASALLKHLQVVESNFFCFLILDNPAKQNDEKNQKRIQAFVSSLSGNAVHANHHQPARTSSSSHRAAAVNDDDSTDDTASESRQDDDLKADESCAQAYGYGHSDNETDDEEIDMDALDKHLILDHIEERFKASYDRMSGYFKQLRQRMNSSKLSKGLVDNQEKLTLSKRIEDFQAKEKSLIFSTEIQLNYEDLNFLMKKYCISDDYAIIKTSVNLNVQMKEACERPEKQASGQAAAFASPDKSVAAKRSSASLSFNLNDSTNPLRRNPTRNASRAENGEAVLNLDAEKKQDDGSRSSICPENGVPVYEQPPPPLKEQPVTSDFSNGKLELVPANSFDLFKAGRTYSRVDYNRSMSFLGNDHVRIKQERDIDEEDAIDLAHAKRTKIV